MLEQILIGLIIILYLGSTALVAAEVAYRSGVAGRLFPRVLPAGFAVHTVMLILRGVEVGRPPLAGMGETLFFLSWFLVLIFLVIRWRYRVQAVGLILVPGAFFLAAVGGIVDQGPRVVQSDLMSPWLGVHAGLSLLAYAAFVLAFSLGLLYVVQEDLLKKRYRGVQHLVLVLVVVLGTGLGIYVGYLLADPTIFEDYTGHRVYGYSQSDWLLIGMGAGVGLVASLAVGWVAARGASRPSFANRLPALHILDQLSSRSILLGFVLLGAGIVSGAVWAQEVWGSYWVWDPKEVWALVAWLFYGGYLAARTWANWRGRYAALLAIAGLFLIVLAFLGVNLLFPGRHDFN